MRSNLFGAGLLMFAVDTFKCYNTVSRRKELELVRCRWEDKHRESSNEECQETFEEENVPPCVNWSRGGSPGQYAR